MEHCTNSATVSTVG